MKVLPILDWLPKYRRSFLRPDVVAGLAVTALMVPHGMAYAELAGLPAVNGLYTTVIALVVYAAFGPSRLLLLGPDSSLAPLIAAAVTLTVADGDLQAAHVLIRERCIHDIHEVDVGALQM